MTPDTVRTPEAVEAEFWAECRKRSAELNIPAWKLAEEMYRHFEVDSRTRDR